MKAYILTLLAVLLLAPSSLAKELKIDNVVVDDGDAGGKTLHVPIVHLTDAPVVAKDVEVRAYFYEVKDNEITPADTSVFSQWKPQTEGWKDSETEDVTFNYTASKQPGRTYIGTIVALYYKGKLEDVWSSAPELLKQFPVAQELK